MPNEPLNLLDELIEIATWLENEDDDMLDDDLALLEGDQ